MLERSEASSSSDSGCETDSFPAPETEEEVEQQQQRQQSDCPLSLDKALGFVDFDSNDFDEVSIASSLVGPSFFNSCLSLVFIILASSVQRSKK